MNALDAIRGKIDKFNSRVMPNCKLSRGILNSEGFAFCALADHLKADLIVESGICNGGSTTIIGKYFTEIPIISMDINTKMEAVVRTSIFHNVTLMNGDSENMLPQIIDTFKDKRIAILIDGPKGERAVNLASKCMSSSNVVMAGVHDLYRRLYGKKKQDRVIFDNLNIDKFVTDDETFVKEFGGLNVNNDGTPYTKSDKYCSDGKGYGPVLGLMLKGM